MRVHAVYSYLHVLNVSYVLQMVHNMKLQWCNLLYAATHAYIYEVNWR